MNFTITLLPYIQYITSIILCNSTNDNITYIKEEVLCLKILVKLKIKKLLH